MHYIPFSIVNLNVNAATKFQKMAEYLLVDIGIYISKRLALHIE